ncbi:phosphate ABC transporter permease PstA [Sporosarcina sp. Marseille-Q4943]|uniref:phosphate ABC transporter permease PstA n=1 Tax=Sporosarcina sp. Marseille-Q4943 TaxID=2942204 RepID=UPI00208DA78B|nr:phosphate ABC transporter permease PstA [Sporosarcina sp. Marseille-Q4943]
MNQLSEKQLTRRTKRRLLLNRFSKSIFMLSAFFGLFFLAVLLVRVVTEGIGSVNLDFLTGKLSTQPERAGIMGAILGTFWLMLVVAPVTMFIGVGTAIYLEMYAKKGRLVSFIQTNISNLAGVPSIVYGILGLTVFVRAMDLGNIVLAGGLTMSLLILPIVIVASQEAIRSIPFHLSEGSYGLGATKWQTIQRIILPAALPGILTGAILSLSRAIGETAPLVVIGIPALLIPFPGSIMDRFTVLPMQIYYWTLDASLVAEYANLAAATIIVLLVALFILNSTAIIIRNKFQRVF